MASKLEKLLAQVAEEKSRLKAKEKADQAKQIREATDLFIRFNLHGIPLDFLRPAMEKIAADYVATVTQTSDKGDTNA